MMFSYLAVALCTIKHIVKLQLIYKSIFIYKTNKCCPPFGVLSKAMPPMSLAQFDQQASRHLNFLIGYMVDHIICYCFNFYPFTGPVDTTEPGVLRCQNLRGTSLNKSLTPSLIYNFILHQLMKQLSLQKKTKNSLQSSCSLLSFTLLPLL